MSSWTRWRVALPMIGLSAIFLSAAVLGGNAGWGHSGLPERVLTVIICLLFAVALVGSLSIAIGSRDRDVPWVRLGLIFLVYVLAFGVTLLRRSVT